MLSLPDASCAWAIFIPTNHYASKYKLYFFSSTCIEEASDNFANKLSDSDLFISEQCQYMKMLSMPTKCRRAKDCAVGLSWLRELVGIKIALRAPSGLRRKCTWRTTAYYNTISWRCEGIRVLLVDFQRKDFAKLNISRCMLHRAPRVVLNLYHNSVVSL